MKEFIRRHRPKYHAVMMIIYTLTAVPIVLWLRESVLVVILISIETALGMHVTGWAAEEAVNGKE